MILTPLSSDQLDPVLNQFEQGLVADPRALAVFRAIAATRHLGADLHAGRYKAIGLAHALGIATLDDDPAHAFSWDGRVIRTKSETSVVFHEIAHWQIAPPERRSLYDFGLGAGPETGRVEEANAAACVDNATKEEEENLASLLGILWEAAHGEPAVLALAEQNWLELPDRPHTARHFARCLEELDRRGLVPPL